MSGCYCANYYGSINCRNTVMKFGDRCKLCVALNSGASMTDGLLPSDNLYMLPTRPPPKRKDSSRSSNGTTTARSSRTATFAQN
ncbi:hypothetical protein P8C59_009211 [Phyllachora maydis]|uniref:Uncharacterized protein n=1 Tax=Phyllachora maydis TaxID=1825666 RepID=A0AAD9IC55_9PEZI|nr:hypothetical protein P8C59_009211 [Phyllachora maydis]